MYRLISKRNGCYEGVSLEVLDELKKALEYSKRGWDDESLVALRFGEVG